MHIKKAYKFRVYPDAKRQDEIDERLILAQQLYNKLLEKTKSEYEKSKNSKINKSTLNRYMKEVINENGGFLKLYSQTRQEVFIRLQKAFQNFFRRVKEKELGKKVKAGFPRFKSRDRYRTLIYPQDNGSFSIEKDRLRVARIGTMKIELHRKIEGRVKTLIIKKEAGNYYAIFTTIKEAEVPKIEDTKSVGIDLGLNSFIALSDRKMIEKQKFMQEKKKRIARWQKIVAKRHKGSKRREKAKFKLQREWGYINSQSNDYLHKLSNMLVNSGYTSFVVEKLNIQSMVKNHNLALAIYRASWNKFIRLLSYKAESAGMKVIEIDARDTSKQCSNCGNIQDMPLSKRIYIYNRCGMQMDRDVNASINILKRATSGQEGSHAWGDSVRPHQEAVIAEPRTYSADCRGSP